MRGWAFRAAAVAACIGVWIGRAWAVFSAAVAKDECEDVQAPANFVVCA